MKANREILRLAIPNIISNITVPLMGIVSTAIAGHWGQRAFGCCHRGIGNRRIDI